VPEVRLHITAFVIPEEGLTSVDARGRGQEATAVLTSGLTAAIKLHSGTSHCSYLPGNLCNFALLRDQRPGTNSPGEIHIPPQTVAMGGKYTVADLSHSGHSPHTITMSEYLSLFPVQLGKWGLISCYFHPVVYGEGTDTRVSVASDSLQPHVLQHSRLPCPSPTPRVYSNSCPLSQWCHQTTLSSVIPFSSCLQSFPASGSCQMSQFFASGGQSIGVSASTSVLPMNTQDLFPLGLTGQISLQSKGLSRVFSNTTVQKHQFFSAQLSL